MESSRRTKGFSKEYGRRKGDPALRLVLLLFQSLTRQCCALLATGADEMCAAGIPGILVNSVCCPNSCGACGGTSPYTIHPSTRIWCRRHPCLLLCTMVKDSHAGFCRYATPGHRHLILKCQKSMFCTQEPVAPAGMAATTLPASKRAAAGASQRWAAFALPPSEPPASSPTVRVSVRVEKRIRYG